MTYGIAAYKVTPSFCREEVEYITSIGGIEIKYEQELGVNLQMEQLQKMYDAVLYNRHCRDHYVCRPRAHIFVTSRRANKGAFQHR